MNTVSQLKYKTDADKDGESYLGPDRHGTWQWDQRCMRLAQKSRVNMPRHLISDIKRLRHRKKENGQGNCTTIGKATLSNGTGGGGAARAAGKIAKYYRPTTPTVPWDLSFF